ncbi:MAG: efflux RND transporter permease subunit [Deltaproteobacteria bacterium]|nr:efflux RND transporter permease subunit [Deltaproteobacteria bacterium]
MLEVSLSGGLTREVRVLADPDRLERFDVSFNDLTMALRAENVNIPSGNVDAGRGDYLLRVPAELATADDLRGVPVKNVGERTVFVGDVARVVDGYAERSTISPGRTASPRSPRRQNRRGEPHRARRRRQGRHDHRR